MIKIPSIIIFDLHSISPREIIWVSYDFEWFTFRLSVVHKTNTSIHVFIRHFFQNFGNVFPRTGISCMSGILMKSVWYQKIISGINPIQISGPTTE